jgi:putative ABC transport system ATP-binding protein
VTLLKCSNLYKSYHYDHIHKDAIIDCNLEIEFGECVTIVGVKGSGKSTLLHLLGGFVRPTSGSIYINQEDITSYSDDELTIMRRNEVGFLFQNDSLIPELTVYENIIMPTILSRRKYDNDYYEDLMNQLHLSGVLKRYPKELTANQLLCVAYARALIHQPNIILVDEPTNHLYQNRGREVLELLLNLVRAYHKTLIMVTQDPVANIYSDHMIRLNKGLIVEDRIINYKSLQR